jgi:CRP-like cAMP-binding protein
MNAFVKKLRSFHELSDLDLSALKAVSSRRRTVPARRDLIQERASPEEVHVVIEGMACRYKLLPNGKRQIFAYLVPGDLCDFQVFILREMDHNIATLTNSTIVEIPRAAILELTENHPAIARALWWCSLVDEAILREWLVNMGQRPASQRIAHLFAELWLRLDTIGLATDRGFRLPLSQEELGDTMGLSTVHVNRSLKELREAGLVTMESREIVIPNMDRLWEYSGFTPRYLHLTGGKKEPGNHAHKAGINR